MMYRVTDQEQRYTYSEWVYINKSRKRRKAKRFLKHNKGKLISLLWVVATIILYKLFAGTGEDGSAILLTAGMALVSWFM